MKKTLRLIVLIQLLFIFSFGVIWKLNANEGEAYCLGNCLPTHGWESAIGTCYADGAQGDEFHGIIYHCIGENYYCQETFCKVPSIWSCWLDGGNTTCF